MSFDLLSEPIKKYIRNKGWSSLRPIQNVAISKILTTNFNYILASRTASGKTEAAFLPILTKVDFNEPGIQVLYISPLIALINDQFYRVDELCKYLDVIVTKWHGEANKTAKNKIVKNPKGIILITPESLEAMFVNKPFDVKSLFENIKYVVLDEIHSFIGTDRGIHLKSILSRLQDINLNKFIVIGLSATIGDYDETKLFTGNENNTKILLDKTPKEINVQFRYFESNTGNLPNELFNNLYQETKFNKVLIFPNSRGKAEEVAVNLKKISKSLNGHSNYFSHHSSIDKEIRTSIEHFSKTNKYQNFCISCTSTLELGIDIGTVDKVIQIDATNNISSLIQRVGRSGRTEGNFSNLIIYATSSWSLLQSIATWKLFKEGFIEPPLKVNQPYDVLLHQVLSIVKEKSGIDLELLVSYLNVNFAFNKINKNEIIEIINHLIKIELLELINNEVIVGLEGEKIVNNRNFYSMFVRIDNFKILNDGIVIGEVPLSNQIKENNNIFLAAHIWKIVLVDEKRKIVNVIPAKDGKKPLFIGNNFETNQKIREKMLEILIDKENIADLDKICLQKIVNMKKDFSNFNLKNIQFDRPMLVSEKKIQFYTFTSTRINNTILFLFSLVEIESQLDDDSSSFEIDLTYNDFIKKWATMSILCSEIDFHLSNLFDKNHAINNFSKWSKYLPLNFKVKLIKEKYFDFKNTEIFLKQINFVINSQAMLFN